MPTLGAMGLVMTDEARERKRQRDRERYRRLKQRPDWELLREKNKIRSSEYRRTHHEECGAREKAWRKANPDKVSGQRKRYYARKKTDPKWIAYEKSPRRKAQKRKAEARYLENGGRELRAIQGFLRRQRQLELFRMDSHAYAKAREKERMKHARRVGAKYKPRPSCRIPDWATMGQEILDRRSVFIYHNLSDDGQASARGFERDLAIESKSGGYHYH